MKYHFLFLKGFRGHNSGKIFREDSHLILSKREEDSFTNICKLKLKVNIGFKLSESKVVNN